MTTMNDSIEAMKLVANISRETGVFEGENGMLKMRVNDLQKQIEQLQARVDEKDKALQAMNPSVAYQELVRLGMPTGKGFNESTFRNSYSNR